MRNYHIGKGAEYLCIGQLMTRGFEVLEPTGEHLPYDLVAIGESGKFKKIQVKSTEYKQHGTFRVVIGKGDSSKIKYDKKDVDFFCVYIKPRNDWYIFTHKWLNGRMTIYFTEKMDKFKNNWGIIK